MSWSTSVTAPDGVLTEELIDQARSNVLTQLDEYSEHDTFAAAVAALQALTPPTNEGRPVIYSLSGHAGAANRSAHGSYSEQQ